MLFIIILIAPAIIMLPWWKEERREKNQKIDNLPVLATCRSGTLAMFSSNVNCPVAHESTQ